MALNFLYSLKQFEFYHYFYLNIILFCILIRSAKDILKSDEKTSSFFRFFNKVITINCVTHFGLISAYTFFLFLFIPLFLLFIFVWFVRPRNLVYLQHDLFPHFSSIVSFFLFLFEKTSQSAVCADTNNQKWIANWTELEEMWLIRVKLMKRFIFLNFFYKPKITAIKCKVFDQSICSTETNKMF